MLMPCILSSICFHVLCAHTQQVVEHRVDHVDIPAGCVVCILIHNHMFKLLVGGYANYGLSLIVRLLKCKLLILIQALKYIA